MKASAYILLLVALFITGCSKTESDLESKNLSGNISKTTYVQYLAIEQAGAIVKGDQVGYTTVNNYNDFGNLTTSSGYNLEGKEIGRTIWFYNIRNQPTERHEYGNTGLLSRKKYEYNERGLLEKEEYYYGPYLDRYYLYFYDDSRKLIEKHHKDSRYFREISLYTYNSNDQVKEQVICDSLKNPRFVHTFQYDDNGNEVERIEMDTAQNQLSITSRVFSEDNYLISYVRTNQEEEIISKSTYEYKFDQNNNWIARIEYHFDTLAYYNEQEIEYTGLFHK